MEVTRREMLTAASAVGVTAALAQGQVGAAVPVAALAPALLGAGSWSPSDVLPSHFRTAARLVRRTAPIAFGGLTGALLQNWAIDSNGDPVPGHRVRGFYKDGEHTNKNKLQVVYAFSYTPGSLMDPHTDYQFFVVGCNFQCQCPKKFAKAATNAIIYDLQHEASFYNGGQLTAEFPNIPTYLIREKSFLSLMLRYLAKKQGQGPLSGVTFTQNSPASSWTLTVTKQP